MARVTIELRKLLEMPNFNLFDFDYPCDDLNFKEYLEQLIIGRYYFDEIASETADKFKWEFKQKMLTIMPYYNQLYATTLYEGDPLVTQRLKETAEDVNTGTQSSTGEATGETKTSDYPQNVNPMTDILSGHQTTVGQTIQTRTDDLKRSQQRIIEGFTGIPYPELIKKHRETLLRIGSLILDELKPLFIMIY
jgi:hypothetical protein